MWIETSDFIVADGTRGFIEQVVDTFYASFTTTTTTGVVVVVNEA